MKLDKIITMANQPMRLRFVALERSLRAVGCDLPLWVIPYDDRKFDLPSGAQWWELPEITNWLRQESTHPVMRKYQTLTTTNYQFVDADICFLRNPEEVLADQSGFITSCCHWHNPGHTYTDQSRALMERQTTTWQRSIFNTGQFACDISLYNSASLIQKAMEPAFIDTCVRLPHNEQPGINMLVFASGVEVSNLTLPPTRMESTWAGDYSGEYESYWKDPTRTPYLMHWAGCPMDRGRPIDRIFHEFLTKEERVEWDRQVLAKSASRKSSLERGRLFARRVKHAFQMLAESER